MAYDRVWCMQGWVKLSYSNKIKSCIDDQLQVLNDTFE